VWPLSVLEAVKALQSQLSAVNRVDYNRLHQTLTALTEGERVNAGLKLHQTPEQKCTIWLDLAGVKVRHLVGFRFVHRPALRSSLRRATKLCGALVKPCCGVCALGFARLAAVFEAVALAVHFQDVDVVG
jgi:hypothetical protein